MGRIFKYFSLYTRKYFTYRHDMAWLYMIRCRSTGEYYLGATTRSPHTRFIEHQTQLRRGVCTIPLLQAAVDKHGLDAFDFVPLREFPDSEIAMREREAIETLKPALNVDGSIAARKPWDRLPPVEIGGITTTLADHARRAGLHYRTVKFRYGRGLRGEALIAPAHKAPRKANRGWYSKGS